MASNFSMTKPLRSFAIRHCFVIHCRFLLLRTSVYNHAAPAYMHSAIGQQANIARAIVQFRGIRAIVFPRAGEDQHGPDGGDQQKGGDGHEYGNGGGLEVAPAPGSRTSGGAAVRARPGRTGFAELFDRAGIRLN